MYNLTYDHKGINLLIIQTDVRNTRVLYSNIKPLTATFLQTQFKVQKASNIYIYYTTNNYNH